MNFPEKARELINTLMVNGWSFAVMHGTDTGESPFISVEGMRGRRKVRVTWHTRDTGTYRLFSCMGRGDSGGMRDLTLTKAVALVEAEELAA